MLHRILFFSVSLASPALAWRVISDLWLQPIVHLDAAHEDRSPFFLSSAQTLELIRLADALFRAEENIINIEGPTKIFGDIHGQFDDMCRLFKAFGSPDHHIGDIEESSYVFLGDIVDRGRHSLEVHQRFAFYYVISICFSSHACTLSSH